MKRKKWTEEEEAALIQQYSELVASGALSRLKSRERKFQPVADRVNALHHLRDPVSFPFRWSWRDVSIKIQNMRHQYLGVKQKIRFPSGSGCCFDWSAGEHHWPNFLFYKQVFGDMDLESAPSSSAVKANSDGGGEEGDEGENNGCDAVAIDDLVEDDDEIAGRRLKLPSRSGLSAAKSLVELGQSLLNREERRRERDRKREEEMQNAENCKREKDHRREMEETAEMQEGRWAWAKEQKNWWRRREQRWEEEEMEWRDRMVGMQMEHEKHMMQMHLDACQAQAQMLGFLMRLVNQFLGSSGGGDAGIGGISNQILHNLQQQHQEHHHQDDPARMGGENGKTDASSAGPYI